MNRRAFPATSAATATAATLEPLGETGVHLTGTPGQALPLGPLFSRYPNSHVEAIDK